MGHRRVDKARYHPTPVDPFVGFGPVTHRAHCGRGPADISPGAATTPRARPGLTAVLATVGGDGLGVGRTGGDDDRCGDQHRRRRPHRARRADPRRAGRPGKSE